MSKVTVTMQDETAVLRLDNGITNAISSELVTDLASALTGVRGSAKGLVLAGNEKFFSIGFNLPELVELDQAGMSDFFTRFDQLCLDLYTLPMPTACAMTGHAVAGGNVLALTCDFRFAAEGKKLIGLNEATIGLPVPYLPDLILRQVVGDRAATGMMYHGRFLPDSEAAAIEPVDEEAQDNMVLSELQRGYMLKGALLRPARVVVGRFERQRNKPPQRSEPLPDDNPLE